jgi:acetyl/propionyl-CoA carboxylase alpha subunit
MRRVGPAMIKKLLIANRGEIAVRVIRTAREMGIRTVSVYSEADAESIHVRMADESVCIGDSQPSASYLDIAKIIDAAKQTGADAVHPGYGFLSERSEFSRGCRDAELAFVGPPPEAMQRLGAKIEAKQLAVQAGVPITPGFFEPGASDARLKLAANEIGFPVMLKASAGGGGRGMRAVHDPEHFDDELNLAREEAVKAFGEGEMMVEKLVDRPRHIEVQFLADAHGNVACLFERECSIQRRHQKLIEESPSPVLFQSPELWGPLREAVTNLVLLSGYVGAGTAEFIYDRTQRAFFFLEVNARLQVEHPVTESITGVDLVEWQLRIAAGEKLALSPDLMSGNRSAMRGHAIEARIIAENPAQDFLPSIGKILAWAEPGQIGVRVDTGFEAGSEVTQYYDSLLAKLIVHAENRERAIAKLTAALEDFHVLGVKANIGFAMAIAQQPDFLKGEFDTGFIDRHLHEWSPGDETARELADLCLAAADSLPVEEGETVGAWAIRDGFRLA